jgi:coproporphyrinogen III oxidase-like Fe-S oxidoreductase
MDSLPTAEALRCIGSAMPDAKEGRDLLIYVHIPFCSSKCTFCAWVAGVPTADLRSPEAVRAQYVAALKLQIAECAPRLTALGYAPAYVYWGGGTPSILASDEIAEIGRTLRAAFDLSGVSEYSVESSPETISAAKVEAFEAIGMTRLSIGVQSFNQQELRHAGRAHSSAEAEKAVVTARNAGCKNLNLDVITGFPKQTAESLAATLRTLAGFRPEHITAYSYEKVPQTTMARAISRGSLKERTLEQRALAQDQAQSALTAAGYGEYMSNYYSLSPMLRFAAEQYYFRWHGDFIGLGSGAHSVLGRHVVVNRRGALENFIRCPTSFDTCRRFSQEEAYTASYQLLASRGLELSYRRFEARFGFEFAALLEQPAMRGLSAALDRAGAPLVCGPDEAHVKGPSAGWRGGDLLRLRAAMIRADADFRDRSAEQARPRPAVPVSQRAGAPG